MKSWRRLPTIVKALRQLAKTTLLVEFSVMQFTIDLQQAYILLKNFKEVSANVQVVLGKISYGVHVLED